MNTEQRILCLAARTQLDADATEQLLDLLRGPLDWERLWAQGHLHDVLPLLTSSLRQLAGHAAIPADWLARGQRRLYATLLHNTALADELVRVCTALRAARVEALPVKGVVLAETLYGNLALRPAADLDVLVRRCDLPTARDVLRGLGFAHRAVPTFAELYHPFHDPQYFRQTARGEVCLELHWALWAARFFHLDVETLWERAVAAQLHGTSVQILSPEDTLLHLAIHRSRSPLRLRFVCDIAELLRLHGATLDWDYLLRQAGMAGARTALFYALALPQELLGAPLPSTILPRLGIGRLKRRLLENTCGITALFGPASPDDLRQQPHLTLRVLEQDGLGQIVQSLGYSLVRTGRKHLHTYRRLRQPEKSAGSG
jgi:hypothetical protein